MTEHRADIAPPRPALPSIDERLRFLRSRAAYPQVRRAPRMLETHMSWLFFAGEQVLKMKKPVRFPFLDFSTLGAREFYSREELRLNTRLAPGIYLGLVALQCTDGELALVAEEDLPAPGRTLDWLVRMRCLPAARRLPRLIAHRRVEARDVDSLVGVLSAFYRQAPAIALGEQEFLAHFEREHAADREVLLRPQFELRDAAVALDRFAAALQDGAALLGARARAGRVVDGHGDLRPEHVWMLDPPVVIDCLEFNAPLRHVDPFDEIAFLALECAIAGAPWIGPRLFEGCVAALHDRPEPPVMALYTAHRALLRARLSMAHLLDPQPRTPQRWPRRAQRYIDSALRALRRPGLGRTGTSAHQGQAPAPLQNE